MLWSYKQTIVPIDPPVVLFSFQILSEKYTFFHTEPEKNYFIACKTS
jgi:hypothetical protein